MRQYGLLFVVILLMWSGMSAGADVFLLTIKVVDDTGTPLDNAKIYIFPDSPWPSAFGNSRGEYVFPLLEPGEKTIFVTARGFLAAQSTASCSEDGWCFPVVVELSDSVGEKPIGAKRLSQEDLRRFDKNLSAFGESGSCSGSLADGIQEVYRVLWDRAFHPPVFTRIVIGDDQSITATWMGIEPHPIEGNTVRRESRRVDICADEITRFEDPDACELWLKAFRSMAEKGVWSQPSSTDPGITIDGSTWTIEARTGEKCHVVERWSPRRRTEFFAFSMFAIQAAGPKLSYEEVY